MKYLIAPLLLLVMACSSDSPNQDCFVFTATIETVCGDQTTRTEYTITESEYDYLKSQMTGTNPCINVRFKDINNTSIEGYLRSAGKSSC